ncbi:hypothetical protein C3747_33g138 [Trypanosoma cruzi]|uniref:SWIM-type domain-containing protein n=2 Tax=Trypanosoma cruzi TaxID=5693 RepID=Q4CWS8_TRYCC|nr:hypothetical protein, conserved [Trypanosoma cruzi]EAN84726.1 hypothetical protein, conserved [Trypanosoma cruzi]PWV14840.1 hypothetical protein C3747_33g138 [Trypanosoma cruzi]RNC60716.1 hypothetical protein TcCL_ESM01539 [Trypanosoma cruzi]|eukprot:XP_806577.1 hypothetical protein [Trypanosoma cruzi strain CL Brener]
MYSCSAQSVPALLTDLVLHNYADHLTSQRTPPANYPITETRTGAASLEETLAPLQLIHGKVFTSAIGIALHGAESIFRYLAYDSCEENEGVPHNEEQERQEEVEDENVNFRGRCLYFVGEHRLFSPYYCPCGAYGYQSIRRQEAWLCKHLLALRIALILEKKGLVRDVIRERQVTRCQLREMMQSLD